MGKQDILEVALRWRNHVHLIVRNGRLAFALRFPPRCPSSKFVERGLRTYIASQAYEIDRQSHVAQNIAVRLVLRRVDHPCSQARAVHKIPGAHCQHHG